MAREIDVLDQTVAFLQKRDGTDKLLKILRYSVKLLLAASWFPSSSETTKRLKSFESSVGVSRKALRLGKFFQDINDIRRAPSSATLEGILELISCSGEGVYYFVEQFIWLVKSGAIDKRHGPRLQKLSAIFELVGYSGSITLKAMQVSELLQREALIRHSMKQQATMIAGGKSSNDEGRKDERDSVSKDMGKLRMLQFKRVLKTLSLIQDISDTFLALADVIDEENQPWILKNAAFLAGAGLLSALISAHKNWVSISCP